jgi:hypothetical protein
MGSDGLRPGDAGCWCDAFANLHMYVKRTPTNGFIRDTPLTTRQQ